jgi:excisionase family DNA binding protein
MQRHYTTQEAGDYLGMTPEAVRRLIRLGRLRASRIGSRLRVGEDALMELLEAVRSKATTAKPRLNGRS